MPSKASSPAPGASSGSSSGDKKAPPPPVEFRYTKLLVDVDIAKELDLSAFCNAQV